MCLGNRRCRGCQLRRGCAALRVGLSRKVLAAKGARGFARPAIQRAKIKGLILLFILF
jgi:hypothetical protein